MEKNIESVSMPILNIVKEVFPNFDSKQIAYTKIVIPKEQAWGTYKIRYNIKVEKQSLNINSLKLYESTLEKLEIFNEENVSIHLFNYENNKAVIVFADIAENNIIGHILL